MRAFPPLLFKISRDTNGAATLNTLNGICVTLSGVVQRSMPPELRAQIPPATLVVVKLASRSSDRKRRTTRT